MTFKMPEPVAWISLESICRLKLGGNGSKGTVPVHAERSAISKSGLFTADQVRAAHEQGRRDVQAEVATKLKRAGAKLPVDNHGTIESAMNTGLSIALALVESEDTTK